MDLEAQENKYDVCVIGCGRVGLPLALSLREIGLSVVGTDINDDTIHTVDSLQMPFKEPGYEELIKNKFTIVNTSINNYPIANSYIITVGTPAAMHIEIDLSQVTNVIVDLISKVDIKNKLIILRSTIAPKTTKYVIKLIKKITGYINGVDYYISMCPERLVEGDAYNELKTLPQIVGVEDDESFIISKKLFEKLNIKIFKVTSIEAELSKILTNVYRYISFAIPNYFSMIASHFGISIDNISKVMTEDYPRMKGFAKRGTVAMSCLRKDFAQINENFPHTDLLVQSYKINEFYPKFMVDFVEDILYNKNVGVLGYTGKRDTDDTRDSLTPKLLKYIERAIPNNIYINEPNLSFGKVIDNFNNREFLNYSLEETIKNSEIIFLAVNHSEYDTLNKEVFKNKIVVDLWNTLDLEIVNYFNGEDK